MIRGMHSLFSIGSTREWCGKLLLAAAIAGLAWQPAQALDATASDYPSKPVELFDVVASGKVRIQINQRYLLREAAQAHRDLEGRRTTGTSILSID